MEAFASETLGFTVRKIADFSRGSEPTVDIRHHFPESVEMADPTMTDGVIHVNVTNLSKSGPVEIPIRHIQETGWRMTVSGIRHSVGSLHEAILSGKYTKKEWREWSALVRGRMAVSDIRIGRNAIDVTGFFR